MILDPDRDAAAFDAMTSHAIAEWPQESVGVLRRESDCLEYERLENRSRTPELTWEALPEELIDSLAIVHSHPSGSEWPSRSDLECQAAAGLPFAVVPVVETNCNPALRVLSPFWWPDTERPYLGRPYRHGVTDCYTLVRDWYQRERGLSLPPVAYGWGWHESDPGLNLYSVWSRREGWTEVEPSVAMPGDLVMLSMSDAGVADHAGVLLEDGLLLHHPSPRPYDPTSLSRRTRLGRLSRRVVGVARPPEAV